MSTFSAEQFGATAVASTSDNSPFSLAIQTAFGAISDDCRRPVPVQSIAETTDCMVSHYLQAAVAPATRRAYQSDLRAFLSWGGTIPSSPQEVARYLADRAKDLSAHTLARRVVAIGRAHTTAGLVNPAKSDLVRSVLRGLKRVHGRPQRRVVPLLKRDMIEIGESIIGLSGLRDRAILLLGFAGALRRSELVALNVSDFQFVQEGMLVTITRSKTDQIGSGRQIAVPFGRTIACPVKAISGWLTASKIDSGPLFRQIGKGGELGASRLSAQSIALIVKAQAQRLGLDATKYSGHSLRSGLVTSAAQAGVSLVKIQQQTGHTSYAVLSRYIRDANLFENNAAGHVL